MDYPQRCRRRRDQGGDRKAPLSPPQRRNPLHDSIILLGISIAGKPLPPHRAPKRGLFRFRRQGRFVNHRRQTLMPRNIPPHAAELRRGEVARRHQRPLSCLTRRLYAQRAQVFHPAPREHREILVVRDAPALGRRQRKPCGFRVRCERLNAVHKQLLPIFSLLWYTSSAWSASR